MPSNAHDVHDDARVKKKAKKEEPAKKQDKKVQRPSCDKPNFKDKE